MAAPCPPEPVKIFVAALFADSAAAGAALERTGVPWGGIDYRGEDHAFEATPYYSDEMGAPLCRRIVSLVELAPPESLVEAKRFTNRIEELFAGPRGRSVNLDIGFVDLDKVVLASAKGLGQKIHLGGGIYADFVCRYRRGRFEPFEWTFPDFRDGRYDRELLEIRSVYRRQLNAAARP